MDSNDTQLLKAIHKVENRVVGLETKIDDSVTGRFKDNERRIQNLEKNQNWVALTILGIVIAQIAQTIFLK